MMCPRCDSARIERWGATIRCAICGMSYDPNHGPNPGPMQAAATQSREPSVPITLLEDSQSFAFEKTAVHALPVRRWPMAAALKASA